MVSVSPTRNRLADNIELSKEFAQKGFTTKTPQKTDSFEEFEAEIQKASDLVIQTMLSSAKYQVLGDDKKNSSSDQLNSITTIAKFKMDKMQMTQALKTAEAQEKAVFAQTAGMIGNRVSVDDSARSYSGGPVTFRYEALGRNVPDNAQIQAQISIVGKDGQEVFSETSNRTRIGKNSFSWNGSDNNGNKVEKGEYYIKVKASYAGTDGQQISILTSTAKEGTVERIEVDDDNNISFVIDGQKYDRSSITGAARGGVQDESEVQKPISEYLGYVGKSVNVKQDAVKFNGKAVSVPFLSNQKFSDARIKVEFTNSDTGEYAYAEYKKDVSEGQNTFSWNGWNSKNANEFSDMSSKTLSPSFVPAGTYNYKITITSKDSSGEEISTPIENKGSFEVTSVDKSAGKVVVISKEGYKFDVKDIEQITDKVPAKDSVNKILQEGTAFIGKFAVFENDEIKYDGKTDANIEFSIPDKPGSDINGARLKIFSSDNKVVIATVNIEAKDLYFENVIEIPKINDYTDLVQWLSGDSLDEVDKYIAKAFNKKRDELSQEQIVDLAKWVEIEFRNGGLYQEDIDPNDLSSVAKNMGRIITTWDGKLDAGGRAQAGTYKYSLEYDLKDNTTNALTTHDVSRTSYGKVLSVFPNDEGQIMLDLGNGVNIPVDKADRIAV